MALNSIVRNGIASLVAGILNSACATVAPVPTSSATVSPGSSCGTIQFKPTPFYRQHPEVAEELCSFVALPEVQHALGFDPLHYAHPIPVSLEPTTILMDNGYQIDGSIALGTLLFEDGFQEKYLAWQGYNPTQFARDLARYKDLTADPTVQQLHRKLLFTHELAHVQDHYHPGSNIDTHDLAERMETKVLENLRPAGIVSATLYIKEKAFLEKHYRE